MPIYGETEHPHAGCRERIAELEAEVERLRAAGEELAQRAALQSGAMASQDERERIAGEACGVPWEEWGCDWPDAVAEKVVSLRAEVERLRAEVETLSRVTAYWDARLGDEAVEPGEIVPHDEPGEIIELRPFHELPTVFVLVTESSHAFFPSREEAEAAAEALEQRKDGP